MDILPDQVVRILHVSIYQNSAFKTINHDKLCKYKHLSEEKQRLSEKFNSEFVRLDFITV